MRTPTRRKKQKVAKLTAEEQQLSKTLGTANTNTPEAKWIEIEQVQDTLPPSTAFIDFARFNVDTFEGIWDPTKKEAAHYAAWITTGADDTGNDGKINFVDLGPAEPIDRLVNRVRSMIEGHASAGDEIQVRGEAEATKLIKNELRKLSEKIWVPLERHLDDADDLILSPDGALWVAPWNALVIGGRSQQYLIEKYGLRFVVSGRDLVCSSRRSFDESTRHPRRPEFR